MSWRPPSRGRFYLGANWRPPIGVHHDRHSLCRIGALVREQTEAGKEVTPPPTPPCVAVCSPLGAALGTSRSVRRQFVTLSPFPVPPVAPQRHHLSGLKKP